MRYNLMTTDSRTDFVKEFVALLRFVAAGDANIGHLRKGSREIHRATDRTGHIANEPVLRPPQEALTRAGVDTNGIKRAQSIMLSTPSTPSLEVVTCAVWRRREYTVIIR